MDFKDKEEEISTYELVEDFSNNLDEENEGIPTYSHKNRF